LASTALGIDFLLLLLKMITPSHEDKGVLTSRRRALLDVISGLGGEGTSAALVLDPVGEISRERAAKARASKDQTQSQPSSTSESDNISQGEALRSDRELSSEFMSVHVGIVADQLQERKRKLHTIQEAKGPSTWPWQWSILGLRKDFLGRKLKLKDVCTELCRRWQQCGHRVLQIFFPRQSQNCRPNPSSRSPSLVLKLLATLLFNKTGSGSQ
jgi:hypothetical protein